MLCLGLTKALILRIGGLRIREVYFGMPIGALGRFRYRGITYVFTALPIFAFVFYEGLMPARACYIPWSNELSQVTTRKKMLGLVLTAVTPLVLLAAASTVLFASVLGPISYGNVRVSSLSATSPFAQQGIRINDIIVKIGEARISNVAELASAMQVYQGKQVSIDVMRDSRFLSPIVLRIPQDALGGGTYAGITVDQVSEEDLILVYKVWSDSPASRAGIQPGDEIVQVNGNKADSLLRLLEYLQGSENRTVEITLVRKGQILPPVQLTPDQARRDRGVLGLELAPVNRGYTLKARGAKILRVLPNTPASQAGLLPGDVLLRVNSEEPNSLWEFRRQTASNIGREITLVVVRRGREMEIKLTPSAEALGPLGVLYEPPQLGTVKLTRAVEQGLLYATYQIVPVIEIVGVNLRKLASPPLMYHDTATHFDLAFVLQMQLNPDRPDLALLAGFIGVAYMLFVFECYFSFWHLLSILYRRTVGSIIVILAVVGVTLALGVLLSLYDLQIYALLAQFDVLREYGSFWIV